MSLNKVKKQREVATWLIWPYQSDNRDAVSCRSYHVQSLPSPLFKSLCKSVCVTVNLCVRVFVCALRIPLGSKSVVIAFVSAGLCTNKRQTSAGAWECASLGAALSLAHFRGVLPFAATTGSNWWMEIGGSGGRKGEGWWWCLMFR